MNLLRRAGAWLRARMIDDAHRAWRFASVRIATIGIILEGLLQFDVLDRWLPPAATRLVSLVLFLAVIAGRLAKKAPTDAG